MRTRRDILGGSAGMAALAAMPAVASPPTPGSDGIDGQARRRGVRFGSCVAWSLPGADAGSFANPRYAALLKADCGLLVPENALKWQATRPAPDRFDFRRFDETIAWASQHGFRMRGHTLLWHHSRWFPKWLNDYPFGKEAAKQAEAILAGHINTVCARYGDRIFSYDVVNEAVDPDTGGYRETSLSRAMGGAEAVLDFAFHTARQAAPHAELVYNDYMSWEAGNEKHREGVLRLLEGFRKRGTPVHTLGVQSHIGIFQPVRSVDELAAKLAPEWRRFLDQVVGMGYRLAITEFDVRDRGLPAALPARDEAVAAYARHYLDLMLGYKQLRDVLVWGMSHRFSWLRTFEPRPDGEITRGSPTDMDLQVKPLHRAIAAALSGAAPR